MRGQALAGALCSRCEARTQLARSACLRLYVPGLLPASPGECGAVPSYPAGFRRTGSLLEALAWCPNLRELSVNEEEQDDGDLYEEDHGPLPARGACCCALPFANLRGLTKLILAFGRADPIKLADVVDALVPLAGLAELRVAFAQPTVVPAALGRLKGLRSLAFHDIRPCALEEGCLYLPHLLSLEFWRCKFHMNALPGVTSLQSLTRLEFSEGLGPRFFDPQLLQLPHLQWMIFDTFHSRFGRACLGLCTLPADLGSLKETLLGVDFSGHGLPRFPLALTQLGALQCLRATWNEFTVLPARLHGPLKG